MSLAFFGLFGWLLFAILFVLAALIAFALRATGRRVTRDDVLIVFTKSIGATLMALACGFVAAMVFDFWQWPAWLATIVAALVAMAAAALTWKFGKAQIR
ncbi:hypothetical protein [Ramlibacter albus]|uniref:Uncharacterized protein n=1 Tax=Ramlibacter albus TaxID=2079448 RepID=A0A923S1R9_9BURK|nr:hypothetical protein [Ramlibacter albus]MBC5764571.1 hypothetical protein [Ramlibacter albus]